MSDKIEMLAALLALRERNRQVTVDSPHNDPVMRIPDFTFNISFNKLLNE